MEEFVHSIHILCPEHPAAAMAGITGAAGNQHPPAEPEEPRLQQALAQPVMLCQWTQGPACNNSASDF